MLDAQRERPHVRLGTERLANGACRSDQKHRVSAVIVLARRAIAVTERTDVPIETGSRAEKVRQIEVQENRTQADRGVVGAHGGVLRRREVEGRNSDRAGDGLVAVGKQAGPPRSWDAVVVEPGARRIVRNHRGNMNRRRRLISGRHAPAERHHERDAEVAVVVESEIFCRSLAGRGQIDLGRGHGENTRRSRIRRTESHRGRTIFGLIGSVGGKDGEREEQSAGQ